MRASHQVLGRRSTCKGYSPRPFMAASCLRPSAIVGVKVIRSWGTACRSTADWASASVVPRGRDLFGYSLTSEAGDAIHEEDVPPTDALAETADQSHGTPSWEGWLRHFGQADSADDAQTTYRSKLQDAVRAEDYAVAARLKKEIAALEAGDAVKTVLHQLEAALAEERYADAAKLRDEGMAGLQGWWCGNAEGDLIGHLLHVGPEYGRWTGRAYTARDLATLSGLKEGSGQLQRLRNSAAGGTRTGSPTATSKSSSSTHGAGGKVSSSVGSPALEIFLQQGAGGEVTARQAVSLVSASRPASPSKRGRSRPGHRRSSSGSGPHPANSGAINSALTALSTLPGVGPMAKLSITIEADGGTRICASPISGHPADLAAQGATGTGYGPEDASAALRQQADTSGSSPSPSSNSITSIGDIGSPLHPMASPAVSEPVVSSMGSGSQSSLFGSGMCGSGTVEDDEEMIVDISAAGAIDVDATVGEEEDLDELPGDAEGSGSEDEDDSFQDGEAGAVFTDLYRVPAEVEVVGRDTFFFRVPREAANTSAPGVSAALSGDGGAGPLAHFEVLLPLALVRSEQAVEALALVAERIAGVQRLQSVGSPVRPEHVADALKQVMRLLLAGEGADVRIPTSGPTPAEARLALGGVSPAAAAASTISTIRYTRVAQDASKTDPMSGLFIASFGPHGPELLKLQRSVVDGEEMVVATKLTGDAHVPTGVTSFKAKVGRKHRLVSRDAYPEDLGVVARYKGEGRVAQRGYSAPRWVEGELLVFKSGNAVASLTGGAELGFVYAVPGERRFLILLNKVDLDACVDKAHQ